MKACDLKPLKSSVCCAPLTTQYATLTLGRYVVVRTEAGVVEGQVVEEVAAGVVDLVLGVVAFDAKRAGPLAEVNLQSAAERRQVAAVGLEQVTPDLRVQFVGRRALQGLCGLPKLQVDPAAEALAGLRDRQMLDDDARLVDGEAVACEIVGAELVYAADGLVEVVVVVPVDAEVDCGATEERERCLIVGWRDGRGSGFPWTAALAG